MTRFTLSATRLVCILYCHSTFCLRCLADKGRSAGPNILNNNIRRRDGLGQRHRGCRRCSCHPQPRAKTKFKTFVYFLRSCNGSLPKDSALNPMIFGGRWLLMAFLFWPFHGGLYPQPKIRAALLGGGTFPFLGQNFDQKYSFFLGRQM